jgi:hypothetical protein
VLDDTKWEVLEGQLADGKYDATIACPPCETHSRSLYSGRPGPLPLRSADYPDGFPWLRGANKKKSGEGEPLTQENSDRLQSGLGVTSQDAIFHGVSRGFGPVQDWHTSLPLAASRAQRFRTGFRRYMLCPPHLPMDDKRSEARKDLIQPRRTSCHWGKGVASI